MAWGSVCTAPRESSPSGGGTFKISLGRHALRPLTHTTPTTIARNHDISSRLVIVHNPKLRRIIQFRISGTFPKFPRRSLSTCRADEEEPGTPTIWFGAAPAASGSPSKLVQSHKLRTAPVTLKAAT